MGVAGIVKYLAVHGQCMSNRTFTLYILLKLLFDPQNDVQEPKLGMRTAPLLASHPSIRLSVESPLSWLSFSSGKWITSPYECVKVRKNNGVCSDDTSSRFYRLIGIIETDELPCGVG